MAELRFAFLPTVEDLNAPTAAVEPYFSAMKAPEKKMTVIENAGHVALATHVLEFIAALKQCPGAPV